MITTLCGPLIIIRPWKVETGCVCEPLLTQEVLTWGWGYGLEDKLQSRRVL